jgi:hypothetical protein
MTFHKIYGDKYRHLFIYGKPDTFCVYGFLDISEDEIGFDILYNTDTAVDLDNFDFSSYNVRKFASKVEEGIDRDDFADDDFRGLYIDLKDARMVKFLSEMREECAKMNVNRAKIPDEFVMKSVSVPRSEQALKRFLRDGDVSDQEGIVVFEKKTPTYIITIRINTHATKWVVNIYARARGASLDALDADKDFIVKDTKDLKAIVETKLERFITTNVLRIEDGTKLKATPYQVTIRSERNAVHENSKQDKNKFTQFLTLNNDAFFNELNALIRKYELKATKAPK